MTGEPGPVVVGGVGGSGTRVFAHLIRELGVYTGNALNRETLDNVWFGVLLGERPQWFRARPAEIQPMLSLFAKAMRGNAALDETESIVLREAVRERLERASRRLGRDLTQGEKDVVCAHERAMRKAGKGPEGPLPWGWKTPESHIFLEQLAAAFPTMKYIHVIRNGLDLVDKAQAKRQVRFWGSIFGIDTEDPTELAPQAVLRYSRHVNQRALTLGPELLGERFLPLHYESACSDPKDTVTTVADFLGLHPDPSVLDAFSAFVRVPTKTLEPSISR